MIETDDDLYRVDQHWLGPPGRAFPKPIRYQSAGIGSLLAIGSWILVFGLLSLPPNGWTVMGMCLLTYYGTKRFTERLGTERTLGSLARSAINDLRSPRPATNSPKKSPTSAQVVSIADQIARVRLTSAHPTTTEKNR
ncbi:MULTISPECIES: hypothetical protein [Rhodococcus]|uniref:hypothetical protein n=1 Tax=Rhodococcus TaxID=1827 RepID=UPI00071E10DA|nr:hypothetical protein [Rhodococcus qingshengii]NHP18523.1 hypothetical protein [Rhodococcus sp. IC4_135]SCC69800.1 hypothetical protein GA0061093_13023 [Rhodococcus qingshengii]